MNRNLILGLVAILIFLTTGLLYLRARSKSPETSLQATPQLISVPHEASQSPNAFDQNEDVLKNALNLYVQKKEQGIDMKNGPCLGSIGPDWVLDIAHEPRQPVDEKSENQCTDFHQGSAHHFIELDPKGKLIRSY